MFRSMIEAKFVSKRIALYLQQVHVLFALLIESILKRHPIPQTQHLPRRLKQKKQHNFPIHGHTDVLEPR